LAGTHADSATDGDLANGSSRLPATGTLGTNNSGTILFTAAGDLPPTMATGATATFAEGLANQDLVGAVTITETNDDAGANNITTINDLYIRLPDSLNAVFNTAVTPDITGTAVTSSRVLAGTISFPDSKTMLIDVTSNFADGETLILGAVTKIQLTTPNGPSSGKLELSYSGGGGPYNVVDTKSITVTTNSYYAVALGNWSSDTAVWTPDPPGSGIGPTGSTDSANIPSGFTVTLDAAKTVNNLTITSGGTLVIGNFDLMVNGTLENAGTNQFTGTGKIVNGSAATIMDSNSGGCQATAGQSDFSHFVPLGLVLRYHGSDPSLVPFAILL